MSEHAHRHVAAHTKAGIDRPPEVRTLTVIEVRFRRGEGCCDEDICREVVAYFDADGTFLAENDPVPGSQWSASDPVRCCGGGYFGEAHICEKSEGSEVVFDPASLSKLTGNR